MFANTKSSLFVCLGALSIGLLASTAFAQQQPVLLSTAGDSGRLYSSMGGAGYSRSRLPNDTIQMLRLPQIKKELGLLDDQIETIGKLSAEMQKQLSAVFKNADFSGDNVGSLMREAQKTIREKMEEKLEEVLLPRQLARLKQIKIQSLLSSQGARALLGGELAEQIHLSDKQRTELAQVHAKKSQELEQEIEQLRKKFREETLSEVLTKSQLKTLEELSGEGYEIKPPDYRAMYNRGTAQEKQKAAANPAPSRSTKE